MKLLSRTGVIISIHALREEGDLTTVHGSSKASDFNPRPPRGGRRYGGKGIYSVPTISIHALREEGDAACQFFKVLLYLFQSTPSARRATNMDYATDGKIPISIHALREEGDRSLQRCCRGGLGYFNPRPPRGGRLRLLLPAPRTKNFNPRPPRGGRRLP